MQGLVAAPFAFLVRALPRKVRRSTNVKAVPRQSGLKTQVVR